MRFFHSRFFYSRFFQARFFNRLIEATASLFAAEAPDVASFDAQTRDLAVLNVTEAPDIARFSSNNQVKLNVTEAADVASFEVHIEPVVVPVPLPFPSGGGGFVRGAYPIPSARKKRTVISLFAIETADAAEFRVQAEFRRSQARFTAFEAEDGVAVKSRVYDAARLSAREAEDRFSAVALDFDVEQHNLTLMMAA